MQQQSSCGRDVQVRRCEVPGQLLGGPESGQYVLIPATNQVQHTADMVDHHSLPSLTRTAMTEGIPQAIVDASLGRQVIHREAEPADIAGSVFLLAADEAGWITGQTIMANGGNAFGL
jgi:Enoyl-(Acyl carrier protein) reductase